MDCKNGSHSWNKAWDWRKRRYVWICENKGCYATKEDGFYFEQEKTNDEGERVLVTEN